MQQVTPHATRDCEVEGGRSAGPPTRNVNVRRASTFWSESTFPTNPIFRGWPDEWPGAEKARLLQLGGETRGGEVVKGRVPNEVVTFGTITAAAADETVIP